MNAIPFYACAAALWGASLALFVRSAPPRFVWVAAWNLVGILLLGFVLAGPSSDVVHQDSLWTLNPFDQAVVAGGTASVFALGVWVTFRVAAAFARRAHTTAVRAQLFIGNVILAAGGCFLFWLLSPQLYYTYYRFIFTGLPDQWVVRTPSDAAYFAESLGLLAQNNLAQTAMGLFFWLTLALTVSVHAVVWRTARSRFEAS